MITYEGEKLICFEAGKLAGIQEVVRWIEKNAEDMPTYSTIEGTEMRIRELPAKYILGEKWQGFLKSKGIG